MLPEMFRSIMWSYDFEKCDPQEMKNTIISNSLNYGNFSHWRWVKSFYGEKAVRERLDKMPLSFRDSVHSLVKIVFSN